MTTTAKILAKIAKLDARLVQIAKKAAHKSTNISEQEMYQIIYLGLLERSMVDPDFFNQTDSFIIKGALWIGTHAARKENTYFIFTDGEGSTVDPDGDDDGNKDIEVKVSNRQSISQAIAQVEVSVMLLELGEKITEAYELLSKENQAIVKMLYLGYKQTEIAKYMNVTKSCISQRVNTIGKVMQPVVKGF